MCDQLQEMDMFFLETQPVSGNLHEKQHNILGM